jgi:DNA polymerase/3'-5' exonuclease PolX
MNLKHALKILDHLGVVLAPACDRLEIAGSVRRQKPVVGDLEMVAVPRFEIRPGNGQASLFGVRTESVSLVWEALERLRLEGRIRPIKPGVGKAEADFEDDAKWPEKRTAASRYLRLWLPNARIKLDLFLTTPERWGPVYVIRTGPAAFSAALVQHWTRVSGGGRFSDGGITDARGNALEAREEADVFHHLGLHVIPPKMRPEDYGAAVKALERYRAS